MKPVLILIDPQRVVTSADNINYVTPVIRCLNALGIPVVTKVVTDPVFDAATDTTPELVIEAAKYSLAFIPHVVTSSGTNIAKFTRWVNGTSGIPCVLHTGAAVWMRPSTEIPTGSSSTSAEYVANQGGYVPVVDAEGNRLYPRYATYYTGALSAGFESVLWGESGTYENKLMAWKTSGRDGTNDSYFTICVDNWVKIVLICKALTAAGVVPEHPFNFYICIDDTQGVTDTLTVGGEGTDNALRGLQQLSEFLRARDTYAVIGHGCIPGDATYDPVTWTATNPLVTAEFVASQDVLKMIVHNHSDLYWSLDGDANIWLTAANKLTAYDSDIAAFQAAGLPVVGRSYEGLIFLPMNTADDVGREALLKGGIRTLRGSRLDVDEDLNLSNQPFGFNDGSEAYKGELAGERSMPSTLTGLEAVTDGAIHLDSFTEAGVASPYTSFDNWGYRCQFAADVMLAAGLHIAWGHSWLLPIESDYSRDTDQSVMVDYLDVFDEMIQASDGWLKWGTVGNGYRGLRLRNR
jgi:hypothetical protein